MKAFVAIHKGNKRNYHTKENCPYLERAEQIRETTVESMQNMEWSECNWCSGEWYCAGPDERKPSLQDLIERGEVETIETNPDELYRYED